MLALAHYERSRCHVCGGDIAECWDGATERLWHVPPPIRCQRGTAIAEARKQFDTNPDVPASHALTFWAERKEI